MRHPASSVFRQATWADTEALVELRLRTMRESLERIGRFDPARARSHFIQGFNPALMQVVSVDDRLVGCFTLRPASAILSWIEHFYIDPDWQGRGLGAQILQAVISDSDAERRSLRLAVLRESDANRFYIRHGFVETHREAWDIFYERRPEG